MSTIPHVRKSKQPEYVKAYNKKYYAARREKILVEQAKKVECKMCGVMVSKYNSHKHRKSKKCKTVAEQRLKDKEN